jgi:hypothetical protein
VGVIGVNTCFSEESESSLSETEEEDTENSDLQAITARSGKICHVKPPAQTRRRAAANILSSRPGLTDYSKNVSFHLDCFTLLLTPEIFQEICSYTNMEANRVGFTAKNVTSTWKPLYPDELKAFLGLFILSGVCEKENRHFKICGVSTKW